ncbi:L-gulonolactone/D-arabinono-1,4-lactone oxidase [Ramicandelaber brevisporus]|nr:L-gulonolactone/D-arabinono-1,4-lactone oxidase [Ramicandelaber brevisporus]
MTINCDSDAVSMAQRLLDSATRNHQFSNWSGTAKCAPDLHVIPSSEDEVAALISHLYTSNTSSNSQRYSVKVVGAGHSMSDLACVDSGWKRTTFFASNPLIMDHIDSNNHANEMSNHANSTPTTVMVDLSRLDKVLDIDKVNRQVTVQAGMRLHDLNDALEQNGLALSSIGSISEQSIGGLIATATHGTGIKYGTISSMVKSLVLVDGTGKVIECSAAENEDVFSAARCHIGCLGVVLKCTLQCEDAFDLDTEQVPVVFRDTLADLENGVVRSAQHVRMWWFPYTNRAVVWRANRAPFGAGINSVQGNNSGSCVWYSLYCVIKGLSRYGFSLFGRLWSWLRDTFHGFHLLQLELFATRFAPSIIPWLAHHHFYTRFNRTIVSRDVSHRAFNFDCLFEQYTSEWAVPLRNTSAALSELADWLESDETTKRQGVYLHFPVEIRFTGADNDPAINAVPGSEIWLSPNATEDMCYIGVIMYRPYGRPVRYRKVWAKYEEIMRKHEGRPHWGKTHTMAPQELGAVYPQYDKFSQMRRQLDPSGLFVNDYIRRHFVV